MRGVIFWIEAGLRLQGGLGALVRQADGVGTAVITLDDIAFAANPVRIVRRGAGHGVREELMSAEMDINGHGNAAFFRCRLQRVAHCPGHFGIEFLELQTFFLLRDLLEILINGHEISSRKVCNRTVSFRDSAAQPAIREKSYQIRRLHNLIGMNGTSARAAELFTPVSSTLITPSACSAVTGLGAPCEIASRMPS